MPARSPFPLAADVEAEEVEALVDVDHAGFLRCQPQPKGCEHSFHFLAQGLGLLPGAQDHDDEVVGIANELPGAQPVFSAPFPLSLGAHQLRPLLAEVVVER